MNRRRDIISSILLLLLIFLAIIQTGFLWFDNQQELLFDFFSAKEENKPISYTYESLFKPKNIYISKGLDIPFYMIKDNSEDFYHIWEDTKIYLTTLFKTNTTYKRRVNLDEYNKINSYISSKAFYIKLPFLISTQQFKNLLNIRDNVSLDIKNIDSIIVLPWRNINEDIVTIYLKSEAYLYQFEVNYDKLSDNKVKYEGYIKKYYDSNSLRYNFISEYFPDEKPFDFYLNQSLLFSFESGNKKFVAFDELILTKSIKIENEEKERYLMEISNKLLGENARNYIVRESSAGSIMMVNINSKYEYTNDGVLKYKKLSDTGSKNNNNAESEYNSVIDKLNELGRFIDTNSLYISGIKEIGSKKYFYFDYEYGNSPVYLNYRDESGEKINHLIEIVFENSEIVEYKVILKNIEIHAKEVEYSINFFDMLDSIFMKIDNIDEFSIDDYRIVYYYQGGSVVITPKWKIFSESNNTYIFDILGKED